MANGADGSIVINTGLDNSGFEKGSNKLTKAIKGIVGWYNKFGKTASNSMQPISSTCQQAAQAMDSTAQSAQNLDNRLSSAVSSSDFGKSMSSAERACASLEKQMQRLSESERMGVKTGTQMTRFQINVEKARDSVNQLEQEMQTLGSRQVSTPEFESLTAQIERAEKALFSLYEKKDIAEQMGVDKSSASWQRLQIQIKNAEYAFTQLESSRDAMQAKGTAYTSGANSAQYQEMAATLRDMQAQLQHYEAMAANFDTVSNPAEQSEASLKKVDKELRQKPKDAGLASKALSAFGSVLKTAASAALRTAASIAKVGFKALATGAKTAASAVGKLVASLAKLPFKAISAGMKKATSALSKFFSRTKDGTMSANGLAKALTSIKRMLISRIKEKMITMLMQSMRQAMTALAQYSSAFNESMSSMKNAATGLGGNLAVTFGNLVNAVAPAITTIINWISKAISYLNAFFALLSGRSFVTVAKQQTDDYASSLGGAAGAAKDLKKEVYGFDELNKATSEDGGGGGGGGGAGDMFEDVPLESLLPESVSNFFNSIKTAFEAGDWQGIGVIIGDGLNVVVTAVDDWITSIQPVAVTWSSRIAQILNGVVLGFDWANLGSTIANGVNTVFATLNTFLTTFDWFTLGTSIGTGVNSLFADVDWALIGQTFANKWNALINTIHGFVTTVNWSGVGTSIATGVSNWFRTINWSGIVGSISASINGVFTALNTAITGADWAGMGTSVATYFTTLFNSIDWTTIVTTLSTSINGFFTALLTAITTADWAGMATTLATNASTLFNSIDWTTIATTLGASVSGLWDALWTAIGEFDWDGAGTSLADGVNALFTPADEGGPIDWASAGTKMSDGLKGVIGGINTFLAEVDWQQIGTDVSTFLGSVDWSGIVSSISTGIGLALGGFAELIWELIETAWNGVVEYWNTEMEANGGDVIATLLSAITTALSNIGQWCLDNIVTPLLGGIETALGLEDGTIANFATNLWEGFKNGLATAWTTLKDAILKPFKDMWQAVKDFFGIASPSTEASSIGGFILEGLSGGLSAGVQAVLDVVSDVFGRIWNAIKSIFGFGSGGESEESKEAKQAGKDIMTGMSEGVTGSEETVKTAVQNAAKNALKELRTQLGIPESGSGSSTKTKPYGEGIVSGVADGITSKGVASTFTSAATTMANAVGSALNTALGVAGSGAFGTGAKTSSKTKYVGEAIVKGVVDGMTSEAVKATFTSVSDELETAITSAIDSALGINEGGTSASELEGAGEAVVTGVKDGIEDKATSSTFTSVANSLKSAVTSAFETALGISWGKATKFETIGKAICEGVAKGINNNTSIIKTAATNAAKAAYNAAKRTLGIASPSKVFEEIGGFTMLGMRDGIEGKQGTVFRAMANIADSLSNSITGSPEVEVTSARVVSGMDAVADKLSNIATTFAAIANVLTAVGGFHAPAVASGAAIPYKARVAAETSQTGVSEPLTAFTTNFDETMSDQKDLLVEIIDILRKLRLVVDGDSLTRTITQLQRSQERAYGGV